MDNQTKQYLSILEERVIRLEKAFEEITMAISIAAQYKPSCNKCGRYDPQGQGKNMDCTLPDCTQGLNPNDEGKGP